MTRPCLSRLAGVSPLLALSGMHAGACQKVVKKKGDARKLRFEPVKSNRRASLAWERAGCLVPPVCECQHADRIDRRLVRPQLLERQPSDRRVIVEHAQ